MKRTISFKKIINVLNNKNWLDEIQLEVEGKFLKTKHYVLVKKWLVPKKLLEKLGMELTMIEGPNKEKSPKVTLKDLIESMNHGFASVNQRLDDIESDVNLIKSLPSIQKEINKTKKSK